MNMANNLILKESPSRSHLRTRSSLKRMRGGTTSITPKRFTVMSGKLKSKSNTLNFMKVPMKQEDNSKFKSRRRSIKRKILKVS
jgi:hypothetical protein